jgi:hypothetical protein
MKYFAGNISDMEAPQPTKSKDLISGFFALISATISFTFMA